MNKHEEKLQIALSKYIKLQYPDVYFTSESSGIRVPIGVASKMKKQRSTHKQLDLIVLEPRHDYHGMVLELKNYDSDIYTKNMEFRKSEHVQEQLQSVNHLNSRGYYAIFACGFDEAKEIVDWYLGTNTKRTPRTLNLNRGMK